VEAYLMEDFLKQPVQESNAMPGEFNVMIVSTLGT